jgi:hypothetical protein
MAKAYVLADGGLTRSMERVRCVNEDRELQLILANNPDLLPGDQIRPEDPRRWLLIEREMPVPDPVSGNNRWSIDLLFVDQSAIPTFVECKRFDDTRARREVIGQMIEYAANGHYYWDEADLATRATKNAEAGGSSLEDLLRSLSPDDDLSVGEFFERLQLNLKEGQLRLVFFLEESPLELRSIVDFLNRQMERSEVLLVEAQQFRDNATTVIYPRLFGFTEEARQVKKSRTVSVGPKRKWDEVSFKESLNENLNESLAKQALSLYSLLTDLAPEKRWGSAVRGSANFYWPSFGNGAFFSLFGNGDLGINFGAMQGSEAAEKFRDTLQRGLTEKLKFTIKDDYKRRYPAYKAIEWGPRLDALREIIESSIPALDGQYG